MPSSLSLHPIPCFNPLSQSCIPSTNTTWTPTVCQALRIEQVNKTGKNCWPHGAHPWMPNGCPPFVWISEPDLATSEARIALLVQAWFLQDSFFHWTKMSISVFLLTCIERLHSTRAFRLQLPPACQNIFFIITLQGKHDLFSYYSWGAEPQSD